MQANPRAKVPDFHLLTAGQGDVPALLLQGLFNKRIALALGIADSTVKEHVSAILERLGVRSRVEAIKGRAVPVQGAARWRLSGAAPGGVVYRSPSF